MVPGKSTINELFNGTRVFEIPFYQRSYVWSEPQWERFLSDMIQVGGKRVDYFLGAIILKQELTNMSKKGDYKIVIDGQQRLTTISIFLKVYYMKKGDNAWFDRKFILPDGNYAILHSHIDRDDFETVMKQNNCEKLDGNSNIIRAYNYFLNNLNPEALDENRVFHHVQVIDIVIDSNDDEQQIFDTINSLGIDLTTAELLKNHLFNEDTIDKYNLLWKPVFEKDEECITFWSQSFLKGRNKQINIEAFLNAFLQIKVHDPSINVSTEEKIEFSKSSGLFTSYKKFLSKHYNGREMNFIKELGDYAIIYRNSFSPQIVECSLDYKSSIERINFLIFATDSTTLIPYVMYVIKNVNDSNERNKIFGYLESYIIRRIICKKSSKSYSDLFSENLILAKATSAESLIKYINEKGPSNNLAMPNNKEVSKNFIDTEFPNNRGLVILYLLESKLRNNPMLSTQLLKFTSYTLEHLMPQKWYTNWPLPPTIDSEEREHKVKTLGNFTLITQHLNSTISNDAWVVKLNGKNGKGGLKAYANGLLTLKDALNSDSWDEYNITKRAIWLAKTSCSIWPSMLLNDVTIEQMDDDYIVDNNSDSHNQRAVISRDLTKYSLDGETYMSKSEFVPYVIKQFVNKYNQLSYSELKSIFQDSLMESSFRFKGLLCTIEDFTNWDNIYKNKRYKVNDDNLLVSSDGVQFYVNSQWTKDSVENIIRVVKDYGFEVTMKL